MNAPSNLQVNITFKWQPNIITHNKQAPFQSLTQKVTVAMVPKVFHILITWAFNVGMEKTRHCLPMKNKSKFHVTFLVTAPYSLLPIQSHEKWCTNKGVPKGIK